MDDSCNDIAEAVAVKGDKIIAVGKHDDVFRLAGAATQVIYLKNQTLLPGFISLSASRNSFANFFMAG